MFEILNEATSLTEEQRKANPDYLIYPTDLEEEVNYVEMFCENYMIEFSVSKTKQIKFSPGNLQYQASTKTWRFAPKQTDYIGEVNKNISTTYSGWIDLFGWGTGDNPTKSSCDDIDYQSFIDWGTNQIGSNAPNTWRTLTINEWGYLLYERLNASSLKGVAQVDGVNGLILLPDNWICPSDITFRSDFSQDYVYAQTFTAEQWAKLEAIGAVFLPAAGRRLCDRDVDHVGRGGFYWSSTSVNSVSGTTLNLSSQGILIIDVFSSNRKSVRLV